MSSLAILLGSSRANGNAAGLASWIEHLFTAVQPDSRAHQIRVIDPHTSPHPLGPVLESRIPATIKSSAEYETAAVQEWSRIVASTSAFVVLTPQFNWGYPGELKNALDHLSYEWVGKPVLLVTYGGRGGGKCAEQLEGVLEGGLKMQLVGKVGISLPGDYIRGDLRVNKVVDREGVPEFLQQYESEVKKGLQALLGGS